METELKDWLEELNKKSVVAEKLETQNKKKDAILAQLSKQIEEEREKILENLALDVVKKNKDGTVDKQKILDYVNRDQTEEFDYDEIKDGFNLESEEDEAKHLALSKMITRMSYALDVEEDELDPETGLPTGNKVKLFSKDDMKEEFYNPLKRQGLVSETFIPDEFSDTREMIDNSFEAYAERLKKERTKSWWDENKSLLKQGLTSLVGLGGSIMTMESVSTGGLKADDFKPKWGDFGDGQGSDRLLQAFGGMAPGDSVREISKLHNMLDTPSIELDAVFKGFEAKEDIGERGERRKELKNVEPPGRTALSPKLAQSIVSNLAAQLGVQFGAADMGMAGSNTFASVVKAAPIASALAADPLEKANIVTVVNLIATGYVKAMETCDTGDEGAKAALTAAGQAMGNSFRSKLNADAVHKILTEEDEKKIDYNGAIQHFVKAGATAVADGWKVPAFITLINSDVTKGKIKKKADDVVTEEFLAQAEELDKETEAENLELQRLKAEGNVERYAGLIDKKINKLKEKSFWLKWSMGVVGMGLDVASKAFGPLAIAGSLLKIAGNVNEAIKRATDLENFIGNQRDMLRAASAFQAPLANFVDNAFVQGLHYEIQVALEGLKLIGIITECTGVGAAVGKGVQAVAGAGQAIESFLYEANKRMALGTAWEKYKLALQRPDNRKLALIAMKKNPTLAKYAVAWGAVIKKDPLVADFMSNCGLDERTLQDPKANVDKVVSYLEARMPDDNVVVGRKVGAAAWAPGNIELKLACWTSARKAGESKADLVPEETRALDAALLQHEKKFPALAEKIANRPYPQNVVQEIRDGIPECQEYLSKINAFFMSYKPKRLVDKSKNETAPHREMEDVATQFQEEVAACEKIMHDSGVR